MPVDRQLELTVGETGRILVAADVDGEVVDVQLDGAPLGAFVSSSGQLSWRPEEAGTFPVTVTATDDDGLAWAGTVVLRSTWPFRDQAMISLGDSVPSGHGLDLEDYLELDPCWRSDESYPHRVYAALQSVGVLDSATSEFAQVSCSGYFTQHLWTRQVTGGFPQADDGPDQMRTQLDWAVRANARYVTITIGANDTGFVGPERLFTEDLELDLDQVDQRLTNIEVGLNFIVTRLLTSTDSTIFVTNYYDPTAANPQGIDGCRTACFAEKSGFVVQGMNDAIERVATSNGERVIFVPVDQLFEGRGAPNGLGPDGFREAGFGAIGDWLNIQVAEIQPYCARGESTGESFVNRIDCVHPNDAGTEAMARAVAAAIATSGR